MSVGAAIDASGRLRAVEIVDGTARPVLDVEIARAGAKALGKLRRSTLVLPDAIALVRLVEKEEIEGEDGKGGKVGKAPKIGASGPAALLRRLADYLPMAGVGAVADAADVGEGRVLLAAARHDDIQAAIAPIAAAEVLPICIEPAAAAYLRLLVSLVGSGAAAPGSVLAVLGAGIDHFISLDASGSPNLLRVCRAGTAIPEGWIEAGGDRLVVVAGGEEAEARLPDLERAAGGAAKRWVPPSASTSPLGGEWTAAYAAALEGGPALDLMPADIRGHVGLRRRRRRWTRMAAGGLVVVTVAAVGAVGTAEAMRRMALSDLAAAEADRTAVRTDLEALSRRLTEAETAILDARGDVHISPLLAAALRTVPAEATLERIETADRVLRAPRRFEVLRPAGEAEAPSVRIVVSGAAPSLEAVEAYRAALAVETDVGEATLRRAEADRDGVVRFEIEVAGSAG